MPVRAPIAVPIPDEGKVDDNALFKAERVKVVKS
jgi:hypothetical protein